MTKTAEKMPVTGRSQHSVNLACVVAADGCAQRLNEGCAALLGSQNEPLLGITRN